MAETIITQEMFDADPSLADRDLKVGDVLPPVKPPQAKPDMVTVDRQMLEDILAEVQGLRNIGEKIQVLEKENEKLLAVADKGRLQLYDAKHNPQGLVRTARAWVYDGKLVKATLTVKNQVFTDVNGRVYTDQVLKVIFEDATEREVTYDQFMKERTLLDGDVIGKNETQNGMFYKLKFKDGKEFEVNYLFLN